MITTTNAGGPLAFAAGGVNGLVAEPTADGIGGARLERARTIAWDRVVERLAADL